VFDRNDKGTHIIFSKAKKHFPDLPY
jgi:hypothetical protein